jgi:peptidoglycan hydrolase-like protein with peptidoglycan-binding domain
VQYNAYVRGNAAILKHLGQPASHTIGHKEWAGAAQGKWDPGGIDMNRFRADVQAAIGGKPPVVTPPVQVPGVPVEYANFGVIKRGDNGIRVISLQTRLKRNYSKIVVDGDFGPDTESKVRDYQSLHPPLVVDGQVGPATAAMLKLVG